MFNLRSNKIKKGGKEIIVVLTLVGSNRLHAILILPKLPPSSPKYGFGIRDLGNYLRHKGLGSGSSTLTIPGASKIKLKNVNKKRMATARRLIFFGISQGINC
jgi:hypothetical protein